MMKVEHPAAAFVAFRWPFLNLFTRLPESPLELKEPWDGHRILDHGLRQRIAPCPFRPSFSVDSPGDIGRVESALKNDQLWGRH